MRLIIFVYCSAYYFCLVFCDITSHQNWKLLDDDVCGISVADRIIGGRVASLGQFPWFAKIGLVQSSKPLEPKNIWFFCGGSLINKYYVLTAAHCFGNVAKGYIVRLGEHNSETLEDCENGVCAEPVQDIKVVQIIIHIDYFKPPITNDIALVRLEHAVDYNGWVGPVCMPRGIQLTKNYVGEIVEVAGWGIYDMATLKASTQLLFVKLEVQALVRCFIEFYNISAIGQGQLCVGGTVNMDSCSGDSGGPLTKLETITGHPRHYILGIVSFGQPDPCGGTAPAVYTNVAHYMKWILDLIEQ